MMSGIFRDFQGEVTDTTDRAFIETNHKQLRHEVELQATVLPVVICHESKYASTSELDGRPPTRR